VQQALEMDEAKGLLLDHDQIKGVRTYVGTSVERDKLPDLLPPPRLGEHTHEFERGWPES